ncbi:Glyoxalase/bleomycin resistance protein/dioxygenase [Drechmeria coniospora]|uniref:Glyoxalase/bleomycin resistance protein/dioxygenase n=1 Tax=Drechmeria coniospora TaxID=98403 RepID=A0A151GLN9_DRECN|nr:Glyoxalase/bleomycin resistance protein/dioxygenase [Drechmeria coniospora]KYK58024.1 Glyoxalase/bleomycin resistance protein/dioxygenase [Drechmeria coniospora]ODA83138.1 hypothetical protein RJ55_01648 [Drechmeria coniospora]
MAESARHKTGEMCWLEIPVHDINRAKKLYADVFGWECQGESMPMPEKVCGIKSMHFFNRGGVHGAFLAMEDGFQQTKHSKQNKEVLPALPTFCVDECNETLETVKKHGGDVQCPKTAIGGDMGHFARFIDTEGNIIGIWSKH